MAIFSPVRSLFSRKARAGGSDVAATVLDLSRTPQWPDDNPDRFTRDYYGRDDLVFACITEIATSGSEARLFPENVTDPKNPEEIADGDLAHLLEEPNPEQSQFEFLEMLHTYLQCIGNSYTFKLRGPTGKVVELHHIRPDRMRVVPGSMNKPKGYLYVYDQGELPIAVDDVIHIKRPNPFNDLYGLSPLHVLQRPVSLSQAILGFQKSFFDNGGVPMGGLKLKRRISDDDEPERLRAQWRSRFGSGAGGGFENWHRVAILDADADWVQIQTDIDKTALPLLSGQNELRICRVFGVPALLVQAQMAVEHGGSLGGTNYREARRSLWDETLSPEYRRIQLGLRRGLRDEFPGQWQIGVDKSEVQALREDATEKAQRFALVFEKGGCNRNEFRVGAGLDPVDGGDVWRVPSGIQEYTLEDLKAGAAGGMDQLFEKGVAFLGEARDAYGLARVTGDDVRQVSIRVSEQTTEQLADREMLLKPPQVTLAVTGPTIDALPTALEDAFPPDAIAAPKPPPVLAPPAGLPAAEPPPASDSHPNPPAGKGRGRRLEQKRRLPARQAKALTTSVRKAKDAAATAAKGDLEGYFRKSASRVAGVLGGKARRTATEAKASQVTADELVPSDADGELAKLLRVIGLRTAQAIWDAINETDVFEPVAFDAALPRVQALLKAAAGRAIDINEVTRQALRDVLAAGYERGYTIQELARGAPADAEKGWDAFPGVRSVIEETYKNRAETIARTETMFAQHGAQLARYDAAGLAEVEAQDGTDDAECDERNGQTYSLDEADGIEDHPNGTLNWLPILPGGDEQSAGDEGD